MAIEGYTIDEIREKIKKAGKNVGFELDFHDNLSLLITKDKIYVKSWDPTCFDMLSIPEMPFNFEDSLDKVLYAQVEDYEDEDLEDFLEGISNRLEENPQGTMWDDVRIEIVNKLRVKDFFEDCDLDNIEPSETDNKLMRIIGENLAYFTKIDQDILREFYEATGIVLAHRLRDKDGKRYCFTMHGYRAEDGDEWYDKIQDEHIVVHHTEPEEIDFSKSEAVKFPDDVYGLNYALSTVGLVESEKSRIDRTQEVLAEYRPDFRYEKDGLKQVLQNTFGEIFLLYEDGTLLRDKKEYAGGVDKLINLGTGGKYIIYKDNSIEPIEAYKHPGRAESGFDKIVARDNGLIALLRKDNLVLLASLCDADGYVEHYFSGVDDIEFKEIKDEVFDGGGDLLIKSGIATIRMRVSEYEPHFVGV